MRKDLNIPSELGNLRLVEKAIDELSLELDLSDEVYGNVLVATMEATNNAIIHGNREDPQKTVTIRVFWDGQHWGYEVADEGGGFDWKGWKEKLRLPIDASMSTGRGLAIIVASDADLRFYDRGSRIVVVPCQSKRQNSENNHPGR